MSFSLVVFVNDSRKPLLVREVTLEQSIETFVSNILKFLIPGRDSIISVKIHYRGRPIADVKTSIINIIGDGIVQGVFTLHYCNHGSLEAYNAEIAQETVQEEDMMMSLLNMIMAQYAA
ncbi:Hypothetical_protein [Hexamita inflata]|uniref:Hypothetical_protein n=1 Tax=Hexamita inflata TaxID=28002 RepID=A0AA86ULY1_9EUKA|nr:Hypothetical protein HINF_LOCUS44192 [Hexamita inflata]